MHGYGVWITKCQLDEAISSSRSSPTKLIRNLLSVFFSNATLASSSALGTGKNPALDQNILSAIIGKSIVFLLSLTLENICVICMCHLAKVVTKL